MCTVNVPVNGPVLAGGAGDALVDDACGVPPCRPWPIRTTPTTTAATTRMTPRLDKTMRRRLPDFLGPGAFESSCGVCSTGGRPAGVDPSGEYAGYSNT